MLINHNPFFNHSKVFRSSSGRVVSLAAGGMCVCVCVCPADAVAASSFGCAHVFLVSFLLWNSLFLCFKNASSCSQVNPVFFKKIIEKFLFVSDQVIFFAVSNTLVYSGGGFRGFRFSRGSTFDSI